MQSKNALGNLKNRYVAVLKKCNLINVFGSLAMVGMLTVGVGSAFAAIESATDGSPVNASGDTVSEAGAGAGNNNYGGFASSTNTAVGESGGNAIADGNTLTITGGTANEVNGGYAASQATSGGATVDSISANGNILTLDAGAVVDRALGGNVQTTTGSTGTVDAMTANDNVVHVHGEVSGSIVGGRVYSGGGSSSPSQQANNNTVNIYDGATVNIVLGGYAYNGYAINNTIILNGAVTFSGIGDLRGGNAGTDGFTGNTLRLNNYVGTKRINGVTSFEKYAFVLPKTTQANDAILQTDSLDLNNGKSGNEFKSAYIESVSIDSGHSLQVGDSVILIDANTIDGTLANDGGTVTSDSTTFTEQEWEINQDNTENDITATFVSEKLAPINPNPPTTDNGSTSTGGGTLAGAVVEAQTGAGTATVKVAGQTFVNAGIPAAQQASGEQSSNAGSTIKAGTWAPFATIQGGYSSYDSGAETDVKTLALVAGLGYTSYFNTGELLVGAFFETGTGSYDSTATSGNTKIHSDGNLHYFGGGVFGRYDFQTAKGTPYVEASARFGSIDSDYDTNDIIDKNTGRGVNYDTHAMYYGMHIGAGYALNLNPKWKLDFSTKYFWTHHESIDKEIGGNRFDFDSINSHMLRVGAKTTYKAVENDRYSFSPYLGIAYEYEFDSNSAASVDNIPIPTQNDLQGSTGVLELGLGYKNVNGFSVNLGVDGSLGKRESIGGKLEFMYKF